MNLMRDSCQGLQHANQQGILHLDIKETNILVFMIKGQLTFKIADFGGSHIIAKNKILMKQSGFTLSTGRDISYTLDYRAPELVDLL